MAGSVFVELKFWLLVLFSLVAPVLMVWVCLSVRALSRNMVLGIGILLVGIAGFDFYLLQALASAALKTPSLADDALFDSEVTVGLYVLPALLAGIGINVASHVLIQHLTDAQHRFAREAGQALPAGEPEVTP
ncbi:MAG TPA: hypothetical protein VGF35_06025 [Steroidobacteraceae bacterium]